MTFSLRGVAWAAFAVAVILLVGSSIYLLRATHALFDSEALVSHTREVQIAVENLSSQVVQLTNSRRGFVIANDEAFLDDYHIAVALVPGDLARLRKLTADRKERQQELNQISSDIDALQNLISQSLNARSAHTSTSEMEIRITRQTAALANRIETSLQNMRDEEDQLLAQRQIAARSNYRHTLRLILASFIIALMLLVAEMFLLSDEFTRHRQTEYAARQSQEIVNAFFSSSAIGFGILDSQFRYTRVNDVLPRMAGLKPEDLLGTPVSKVFGQSGKQAETVLQRVIESGQPVLDREVSADLPSKPGDPQRWLVNYFPIREHGGAITQVGVTAIDVTARRNAEDALRTLSGRLLGIQDQERRRIARELHDSLGQYLAGLKIAIDMLSSRSAEKDPLLVECADILERAITETRTLSHLLHPPLLDEAGFASAATWFVAGFSQRSGIPVSLDLPPDLERLPDVIEIALFRVLQESLTNVHRHSRAKSAEISVDVDAEQVTIEIRDHGRGMPPNIIKQIEAETSKLGVGLAGMRERIHELGGRFVVSSNASGTTVQATIPLGGDHAAPVRVGTEHIV
jgi:PAS domain S-box-containing protein